MPTRSSPFSASEIRPGPTSSPASRRIRPNVTTWRTKPRSEPGCAYGGTNALCRARAYDSPDERGCRRATLRRVAVIQAGRVQAERGVGDAAAGGEFADGE